MFKTKKITQELLKIDKKTPIYICGHIKADQDSVGASIVLAEFLSHYGKNVYILLSPKDTNILAWKPTTKFITDKIEHEHYVFVAIDINETYRLGEFEKYYLKADIKFNIDHHQGNSTNADFVLDVPEVSSTCEIIYTLIYRHNKNLLTKEMCEYLYAGIFTDTNGLSRRLSPHTLEIVQKLVNKNISYAQINRLTLSLRTMYEFVALSHMVKELVKEKHFHYLVVDKNRPEYSKLSLNTITKKLAEDLRKIDEIDTFVVLILNHDNSINAKTMTNSTALACDIAKLFGGGGHKKEAGFTTNNFTVEEIVLKTNQFLEKVLNK